jgi:hypothetical protein
VIRLVAVGVILALAIVAAPIVSDAFAPEAAADHICEPPVPCCHGPDCLAIARLVRHLA